ncbi:MAG: hypothetical protein ACFBSG_08470 [Leptolyngbyaceae cyanobacterium]
MTNSARQDGGSATPPSDHEVDSAPQQVEYRLCSPRLPLAAYREVAAHLRQIEGVNTGLLPQTSKEFDYLQSQVGGIWIRYTAAAANRCQPRVEAILTYYGDRYGQWETFGK